MSIKYSMLNMRVIADMIIRVRSLFIKIESENYSR